MRGNMPYWALAEVQGLARPDRGGARVCRASVARPKPPFEGGKWRPRLFRRPRDEGRPPSADAPRPSDGEIGDLARGLGPAPGAHPGKSSPIQPALFFSSGSQARLVPGLGGAHVDGTPSS